ncbi:isoprenoid synthase domain-containing protein [Flammula alnicola]|nr:isoprenoid synthase domain-containing protein [Flammula alnicola]
MSLSHSFQLPDLLAIIGPLELRTNSHCRFATDVSEEWISKELNILSECELSYLRSTKTGLLSALCFPTCDAPQLRVLTNFMTLLLYSSIRACTPNDSQRLLWEPKLEQSESIEKIMGKSQSGVDMLRSHALLMHVIDNGICGRCGKASESWNSRFTQSVKLLRSAQEKVLSHQSKNHMPALDEYIEMRREMYGSSMTFDLAELLEIFQYPELQGASADILVDIKRAAFDVIAWSMDVVSYQLDHSRGNNHNLVTVLMFHKNLSVQGAMKLSGNMVRDAFGSFCKSEQNILDSLTSPNKSMAFPILSWVWKPLASDAVARDEEASVVGDNVRRYIRALKDCIAGTIHWAYETELFFGKKGGEVRTFGWVFVDQVPSLPTNV